MSNFNPDKIYITNVLQKGKPIIDGEKGLINPLVLNISNDTLSKLKAKKPIENICEKCFCVKYCPDKNNAEIVDWCIKTSSSKYAIGGVDLAKGRDFTVVNGEVQA